MTPYNKILFTAMLTAMFLAPFSGYAEDEDFDAFFRAFKEKRDGIGALQAHFIQKTFLPDEIVTSEGILYYSKPRRIMFKTEEPDRAILVDGRRGYEYDAEIRQITIFDIEDHPRADIFFLGFDDDTETLQRAYNVQLMITHDARGMHGIKIEPRLDTDDAVYFMEVNLFLREEDYLPYRIHIVNDEESQVFIEIDDILPQAAPDLDRARILVPSGVKVIENDAVVDTVLEERYFPAADSAPHLVEREIPPQEDSDNTMVEQEP